jgi:hypothetical protein
MQSGNPWNIPDFEFWLQLYNSSSTFAQSVFTNQSNPDILIIVQNLRNAQMRTNIAWWANQTTSTGLPRKIIVFTDSLHSNQNLDAIDYNLGENRSFGWVVVIIVFPCPLVTAGKKYL